MIFRRSPYLLVLVLLACSIGCSKSKARPENYSVSGVVRYADGSPVVGAKIMFSPVGGANLDSEGVCESNGSYTVQTLDGLEGTPAGKYRVSFEPIPGVPQAQEVLDGMPGRLFDSETTDLFVSVEAIDNVIDITLPVK